MKSQSLFLISIGIASALLGSSLALITHQPPVATAPPVQPPVSSQVTATAPVTQPAPAALATASGQPAESTIAPGVDVASRAWRDDQLQLGYDLNQLSQQLYEALHDPKAAALRALLSRQYDRCTEVTSPAAPPVDLDTQARCQALLHILRQSEGFAPSPDSSASPQP